MMFSPASEPTERSNPHQRPRVRVKHEHHEGFLVTTLTLRYPDLPVELHGMRFVQLSDLHFGPVTPVLHLERAAQVANSFAPDVLLLTGDYMQLSTAGISRMIFSTGHMTTDYRFLKHRRAVRESAERLGKILSLVRARRGVYGVWGNHDYSEGLKMLQPRLGAHIRWLINDACSLDTTPPVHLAGIDDLRYGKPDLQKTIDRLTTRSADFPGPRILLSHNPDIVLAKDATLLSEVDLILCGHTHGGQIRLPILGAVTTQTKQRAHIQGLSTVGSTSLYVSNGVGFGGIKVRLNCPPEIVVVELQ